MSVVFSMIAIGLGGMTLYNLVGQSSSTWIQSGDQKKKLLQNSTQKDTYNMQKELYRLNNVIGESANNEYDLLKFKKASAFTKAYNIDDPSGMQRGFEQIKEYGYRKGRAQAGMNAVNPPNYV